MGDFPYTDVGSHYPCGPGSAGLIDTENAQNLVEQNSVGVKNDGSPPGNGDARGPIQRDGSPGGHFTRGIDFVDSTFDVRGLTSHAMVMWVRLNEPDGQPFAWSVWNFSAANQQYWVLHARAGASGGPQFGMYDGLTVNNSLAIKASAADVAIDDDSWHMIGGGWDSSTNTMSCFWGDGSDGTGNTTFYQEASGFAAGYGATINCQCNNVGKFSNLNETEFDIDHASHWRGRAFNEDDFQNHWQVGAGLAFADFDEQPPPICWNYTAFYRNSKKMYKVSGPGTFPKYLKVPGNVDITRGMMVDNGKLIDPEDYRVR